MELGRLHFAQPPSQLSTMDERKMDMAARVESITGNPVVKRQAWKALEAHSKEIQKSHLRNLFADDPKRGERLTL